MNTVETMASTTYICDIASESNPESVQLPDITYDKLIDLEWLEYDQPTGQTPPICHDRHARCNDNYYSKEPQVNNYAIPQHVVDLIRSHPYDMGERKGCLAEVSLSRDFNNPITSHQHLTDCYNKQNIGKGKIKTVLYSRKRKASDEEPIETSETIGRDGRGRAIDRIVWSTSRNAAHRRLSASQRQRNRSPTPVPEPVFPVPAENFQSLATHQFAPTPVQEPHQYSQTALFKSSSKQFRNPAITTETRRAAIGTHKAGQEAMIAADRQKHGGLIIQLGSRVRRIHGAHQFALIDRITDTYADAFEDWDEEMRNSSLQVFEGYAVDVARRKWFTTMWDMPGNALYQESVILKFLSIDPNSREEWADGVWEGKPLCALKRLDDHEAASMQM